MIVDKVNYGMNCKKFNLLVVYLGRSILGVEDDDLFWSIDADNDEMTLFLSL